ncbi:DNA sulfur modification protein DndB [Paenibacillus mendelii]|uniref:DNA sulfur modification protein DndB n=1 Tax=Paenibacillus mendelii TaxID=206163 RepID=A0ABV6JCA2_9BACL|nr:DNA sulfur modification protein DndB [Paenibacillus mendelii]MCQ6561526.1 DGQHR domain-containing protein [Paenibacillus mendelii]
MTTTDSNRGITVGASKGQQNGKTTFVTQLPYNRLKSWLTIDTARQRRVFPKKVDDLEKYVIDGFNGQYSGFNAIAVSLRNGELNYDEKTGTIYLPDEHEGVRFFICDGQHRYYGIIQAYERASNMRWEIDEEGERENWERIFNAFGTSTLPVVIYTGLTLDEEEQLFSDMNFKATPVNQSKALQHDKRDIYNKLAKELANEIPDIAKFGVDIESKVLSDKLEYISTLATWNRVNRILINGPKETDLAKEWDDEERDYDTTKAKLKAFWEDLLAVLPDDYNNRGKYMITKSVYIQGLAAWGHKLFNMPRNDRQTVLQKLSDFNWGYDNVDYAKHGGGNLNKGRMQFIGTRAAIKSIPAVLDAKVS